MRGNKLTKLTKLTGYSCGIAKRVLTALHAWRQVLSSSISYLGGNAVALLDAIADPLPKVFEFLGDVVIP